MIKKITRSNTFIKQTKHLDNFLLKKLKLQIVKIIENPFVGKPLKYARGEKSLYIKPFRLIYAIKENELILLKFEHRKKVYK
ncbi:MAG: type II toxin-antitoxin system RelE/ParE family toxin [Nanoarchaeota archaeon]|nr:type II toxin-antitoxin system RelE/ParE family toxin [Nanoarchaeota archaeon]